MNITVKHLFLIEELELDFRLFKRTGKLKVCLGEVIFEIIPQKKTNLFTLSKFQEATSLAMSFQRIEDYKKANKPNVFISRFQLNVTGTTAWTNPHAARPPLSVNRCACK